MNLASNVNFLLGLQNQLRINHWQTKGYARHIAFGEAYDQLGDLIDSYLESAMGKYGRFVLDEENKTIQLINLSEVNPKDMISTSIRLLEDFSTQVDEKDTDLLNLRDEMIATLSKLLYLLTLE